MEKLLRCLTMLFLPIVSALRKAKAPLPNLNPLMQRMKCLDRLQFTVGSASFNELEDQYAHAISPRTHRHTKGCRCLSLTVTGVNDN